MTPVPNIDFTRSHSDLMFSSMPEIMCPQKSPEQIPFPRENKEADNQKTLCHGATKGQANKKYEFRVTLHPHNTIAEAEEVALSSRLVA